MQPSGKRVVVLDTSAFIAGVDPFSIREEKVVPPKVEEEVKKNNLTTLRFNTAVDSGALKIISPTAEAVEQVKATATSLGDSFLLSGTDMQVLALAVDIKAKGENAEIFTDDYSIQNVATKLGVAVVSLTTLGIKRVVNWVRYCPACRKVYPANFKFVECVVCGTRLKRKPQRATNISKT